MLRSCISSFVTCVLGSLVIEVARLQVLKFWDHLKSGLVLLANNLLVRISFKLHALLNSQIGKLLLSLLGVLWLHYKTRGVCLVLRILIEGILKNGVVRIDVVFHFPLMLLFWRLCNSTRNSAVRPTEVFLENSFLQMWLYFKAFHIVLLLLSLLTR